MDWEANMPTIALNSISKRYDKGGVKAVADLNAPVAGEIVAGHG